MNDRRHELQQNELALYMDRINKAIEPYSKLIAVVVGAAFIGAIAWGFLKSQQTSQRSDATLNLIQAAGSQDSEQLLSVGEEYGDTVAGNWARLYQGNAYLSEGIQALFNNRDDATQLLGDAEAAFRFALTTSKDPLLLSRGHFGLARAAESLGNVETAIEEYRETIKIGESEEMIEMAEARIAALSDPDTEQFLTWFADQDFSPSDPSLPPALPGSNQLPDLPDLDLPDLDLPGGENSDVMDLENSIELPEDTDATSDPDMTPDAAVEETDTIDSTEPAEEPAKVEPAKKAEPKQAETESDDAGDQ